MDQLLPVAVQGMPKGGGHRIDEIFAHPHHDIQVTQCPLVASKALSNQSLETVARHCCMHGLATNGQAQPRVAKTIGTREHNNRRVAHLAWASEDTPKIYPA